MDVSILFPEVNVLTPHIFVLNVLKMNSLRLKTSAIEAVTGYSRFRLRGLLAEVFPKSASERKSSTHRTFTRQEVLLIAVVCEIEEKFGTDRKKLALIATPLRRVLFGPRESNREARLQIIFKPPTVTYLEGPSSVTEGIVLRLGPVFANVDEFLGVSSSVAGYMQPDLPLPPSVVDGRRGGTRAR